MNPVAIAKIVGIALIAVLVAGILLIGAMFIGNFSVAGHRARLWGMDSPFSRVDSETRLNTTETGRVLNFSALPEQVAEDEWINKLKPGEWHITNGDDVVVNTIIINVIAIPVNITSTTGRSTISFNDRIFGLANTRETERAMEAKRDRDLATAERNRDRHIRDLAAKAANETLWAERLKEIDEEIKTLKSDTLNPLDNLFRVSAVNSGTRGRTLTITLNESEGFLAYGNSVLHVAINERFFDDTTFARSIIINTERGHVNMTTPIITEATAARRGELLDLIVARYDSAGMTYNRANGTIRLTSTWALMDSEAVRDRLSRQLTTNQSRQLREWEDELATLARVYHRLGRFEVNSTGERALFRRAGDTNITIVGTEIRHFVSFNGVGHVDLSRARINHRADIVTQSGNVTLGDAIVSTNERAVIVRSNSSHVTFGTIAGGFSYMGFDDNPLRDERVEVAAAGRVSGSVVGGLFFTRNKDAEITIGRIVGRMDAEITGDGTLTVTHFIQTTNAESFINANSGDINIRNANTIHNLRIRTTSGNISLSARSQSAEDVNSKIILETRSGRVNFNGRAETVDRTGTGNAVGTVLAASNFVGVLEANISGGSLNIREIAATVLIDVTATGGANVDARINNFRNESIIRAQSGRINLALVSTRRAVIEFEGNNLPNISNVIGYNVWSEGVVRIHGAEPTDSKFLIRNTSGSGNISSFT
ncbi:MAG: DUF4097 family beta strand repeat-containing protein [Firmicutes bacterium]|nr:DUF4097 family beta strand repeat-containing protein [Bacillota bacterium]